MIVSCGEALVDVLPDGQIVPGGGPMNAAVAAARLGASAAFVGRVSNDSFGDQIWAHMEASNVVLDVAQRGPEPTARAVVETTPVQRFTFYGEHTADASMDPPDLTPLGLGSGSVADVLHGGTLGIFRGSTADVLAELCRTFDGLVSFDPNVRPAIIEQTGAENWWRYADVWLGRADLVRGSDEDFEWMGVTVADLLERGPRAVVETRGSEGATVHLKSGETVAVPAAAIDFVDAVGAGDSFCGAMLTQLASTGWPANTEAWEHILGFAVSVAGITCSRAGANPPWADEI